MSGASKKSSQTISLPFKKPQSKPHSNNINRDTFIQNLVSGFVSRSKSNKLYYRIIVEELWPKGHGIPGPILHPSKLRDAIDRERKKYWKKAEPYKPYVDVFRRLRELQGEEGLIGLVKKGQKYQLVDLTLGPKRVPRVNLNDKDWQKVLMKYNFSCAVCKRKEPEVQFDQDHKIPRTRGGGNPLYNWQPLCRECNNFKSTSCRGCELDCYKCPWAFPEKNTLVLVTKENQEKINTLAVKRNESPNKLLNSLLKVILDEEINWVYFFVKKN